MNDEQVDGKARPDVSRRGLLGMGVGAAAAVGGLPLLARAAGASTSEPVDVEPVQVLDAATIAQLTAAPAPTPGLQYVTVNLHEWRPETSGPIGFTSNDTGMYSKEPPPSPYVRLFAGLSLPVGSIIREFMVWGGQGVKVELWESPVDVQPSTVLRTLTLPAGAGVQSATLTNLNLPTSAGYSYVLRAYDTSQTAGILSARIGYTPPALQFVPITPARVYDSRFPGTGGRLSNGQSRVISVRDAINPTTGAVVTPNVVPAGAAAVTFNLTIVDTQVSGYLGVNPGDGAPTGSSAINWYQSGQIVANGTLCRLSSTRTLLVFCGGAGPTSSTHFLFDITGYYL